MKSNENRSRAGSPQIKNPEKLWVSGKARRVLMEMPVNGDVENISSVQMDFHSTTLFRECPSAITHHHPYNNSVSCDDLHSSTLQSQAFSLPLPPVSRLHRQEETLKVWINNIVCSPEDVVSTEEEPLVGGIAARHLRRCMWKVYTEDALLRETILKIEERLQNGHLKVLNAEAVLKGVKERACSRRALSAYHPLWLGLATEIAVGCTDISAVFFDAPLLNRHHGIRSPLFWSQLGALVVNRLLLIIALLDRTAAAPPLFAAPLLFRPGHGISKSEEAVQALLAPFFQTAEVPRLLSRLGFHLSYVQTPKEEMNFKIVNLARDMRNGLRLCRLVDIVLLQKSDAGLLFDAARFPASRRPDRLHNVELALKSLERGGMDLKGVEKVIAAAIVDGERTSTLNLLWKLVLQHEIPRMADCAQISMEIDHLGLRTPQLAAVESEIAELTVLLQWMSAVAGKYGVQVRNFREDVADGRAWCTVIYHYLGASHHLVRGMFTRQPSSLRLAVAEGRVRANFAIVQSAATFLEVPVLVTAEDFLEDGGPDERQSALFTAYLCNRLIEAHREQRAAMVIQRCWRKKVLYTLPGTSREHLHRWIDAASVIQRCVRTWLLRRGVHQFAEERQRLEGAATTIQAAWRAYSARTQFRRTQTAVISIQRKFRGVLARRAASERLSAIICIQRGVRRFLSTRRGSSVEQTKYRMAELACVLSQFAARTAAATKIQVAWRAK